METVGKAMGTAAVWGGVGGLSYMFHSFGMFDGSGAVGLVVVGLVVTLGIWNIKIE